jgi:hypothetical protein
MPPKPWGNTVIYGETSTRTVPLAFQIRLFRVGLRADRDIFASRH